MAHDRDEIQDFNLKTSYREAIEKTISLLEAGQKSLKIFAKPRTWTKNHLHSSLYLSMPRKPSKVDMKKYDLEAFVERKAQLLFACEAELNILRDDPKGAEIARKELERNGMCLEGNLPSAPEEAKAFLAKCERLVEQPATNHLQCVS